MSFDKIEDEILRKATKRFSQDWLQDPDAILELIDLVKFAFDIGTDVGQEWARETVNDWYEHRPTWR